MSNLQVDTKDVLRLFADLSPKKQSRAFKNALKRGAQILVRETRKQLRASGIKGVTKRHPEWKNISLNSGIKYGISRKQDNMATVHIMGDFRLKFFEKGTAPRHYIRKVGAGKVHNTGSIRGVNFFARAKSLKETEIFENMNRLLAESIQKIANKK